jgi:long-chain acyl-CoA synthetase
LFAFYRSLGLNLKQLYGQTEASVYITACSRTARSFADTVGQASPDVDLKLSDTGEVLFQVAGCVRRLL